MIRIGNRNASIKTYTQGLNQSRQAPYFYLPAGFLLCHLFFFLNAFENTSVNCLGCMASVILKNVIYLIVQKA
jgi:hypothetical protein